MPRFARLSRRSWLLRAGGLLGLGVLGSPLGCGMFRGTFTDVAANLPPLQTGRDAIQVEVVIVERPQGDAMIGDILWRDIDQLSIADADTRQRLKSNGLRVGHVSSRPPAVLQELLGLTGTEASDAAGLTGRRIWRQSGEATRVQTGPVQPECRLTIVDGTTSESDEFEQAQPQFRVVSRRMQDGWVEMSFTPEIHFGNRRLRPTVVDDEGIGQLSLQLRTTQKMQPFHRHGFGVTVNVGEMVIIGMTSDAGPESLGRAFFQSHGDGPTQRLLVVRLADMGKLAPIYGQ